MELAAVHCEKLSKIPEFPDTLVRIDFTECNLTYICKSLVSLIWLQKLNVSWNRRLETLPLLPKELAILKITGCHSLMVPTLPEGLMVIF